VSVGDDKLTIDEEERFSKVQNEQGDIPVPQIPTKAGLILSWPGLHTGSSTSSIRISSFP
jgi:hypothetical protein